MHEIEPFGNWRHLYLAEEDERSPFFQREHSEFFFSNTIYNYYIHPQWDTFGSSTLYMKALYADYDLRFCILEFIGEWNDAVENDIMQLKRSVIDVMQETGICKFILVIENVLTFHYSDESYYEEWSEDLQENNGWVVLMNIPDHELEEFKKAHLDNYCFFLNCITWRTFKPQHLFEAIEHQIGRRRLESGMSD